jgi:hypothetical protein
MAQSGQEDIATAKKGMGEQISYARRNQYVEKKTDSKPISYSIF